MSEVRVVEYLDSRGRSPWARWFDDLEPRAAARVATAIYRLAQGNLSGVKGVGSGVLERVIDSGPGYRIYFGRDADTLVILLGGSTKHRQQQAIENAKAHWADYQRRKQGR